MVDLLRSLDLRWIMGEVLVDGKVEVEYASFIHSLIRLDCESEVQDVVRVGKVCPHSTAQGKL